MTDEEKKKKLFELLTKPQKKTLSQNSLIAPFWETLKRGGEAVVQSKRLVESKVNPASLPFLRDPKFMSKEQLADRGNIIGDTAKSTAGIASWATPFGKGSNILTKALLPGAGVGLTSGLADEKKSNPLMDALYGAGGAGLFRGATNTLGFAGRKLTQELPRSFMGSVLKEKPGEALAAYKKKMPLSKEALDRGVTGSPDSIFNRAVEEVEKFEGKLQSKLKTSKAAISITELAKEINPFVNKLKDAGNKAGAKSITDRVTALAKRHGDTAPIAKANEIKRTLYSEINDTAFQTTSTANKEGLKGIARAFKKQIASKVSGVDEINKELAAWGRIRDAAGRTASAAGQGGLSALDALLGVSTIGGGVLAGPQGAVLPGLAFLGNLVKESPTARTTTATALNTLGKVRRPNVQSGILDRLLGQAGGRMGSVFTGQESPPQIPNQNINPNSINPINQRIDQLAPSISQGVNSATQPMAQAQITTGGDYNQVTGEGYTSPDGQWKWSAKANDWVPNETAQTGESKSGYTADQFDTAIAAATDKKTLDFLVAKKKALFGDGEDGGLQLSDTAIKIVTDYDAGIADLAELKKIVTREDATGVGKGVIGKLPWAIKTKITQAQLDRVKQSVGKALEGGVLRKEDEEKYKKILATISDPNAVSVSKIQNLLTTLERNRKIYYDAQAKYGKGRSLENTLSGYAQDQSYLNEEK